MLRSRLARFIIVLLLIEFLDELVFGAREAAWPLIRDDLALSYAQVGVLLRLNVAMWLLLAGPVALVVGLRKGDASGAEA